MSTQIPISSWTPNCAFQNITRMSLFIKRRLLWNGIYLLRNDSGYLENNYRIDQEFDITCRYI